MADLKMNKAFEGQICPSSASRQALSPRSGATPNCEAHSMNALEQAGASRPPDQAYVSRNASARNVRKSGNAARKVPWSQSHQASSIICPATASV